MSKFGFYNLWHKLRVLQQNCYKVTSNTDFRNKSALDPCSINMSEICFIRFDPKSDSTFKQLGDRGMRIMVESDNDHNSFWSMSIGLNWSRKRCVRLVPENLKNKQLKVQLLYRKVNIKTDEIYISKLKKENKWTIMFFYFIK